MFRKLGEKLNCIDCFHKEESQTDDVDHQPQLVNISLTKENEVTRREADHHGELSKDLDESLKPEPFRINLWEVAFERLGPNKKELLRTEKADSMAKVLGGVIDETTGRYQIYARGNVMKKTPMSESQRGKSSSLRCRLKILSKVLLRLTQQAVVTSTAWAIVSFGLTLVKNDIDRRDALMEASEYLAEVLAYHIIIDNKYRLENVESNQGLEDAIVEVYVAILEYIAEVKKASQERCGARVGKSITALVEKPLEQLKATIKNKSETVDKWKALNQVADQIQRAESMLAKMDQTAKDIKSIDSRVRSNEELQILEWLSQASYSKMQNNTQGRRTTDTGNWFLESKEYIQWIHEPGTILWLRGAVGCGKSVMCSSIIKDVEKNCENDLERKLAYWYFQFDNEESKSVDNMIRSVLRQLSPNPLPDYICKLWEDCRSGRVPSKEEFLQSLKTLIDEFQGNVFLIYDALDECPDIPGNRERKALMTVMEALLEDHEKKIHILATSRPEPDIRARFEKHEFFELENGLSDDVETFISKELELGKLRIWNPTIQDMIREKLLGVSERHFRWADLQIKRLEECHIESDIRERLETIPESLNKTYEDILTKLPKKYQEAARSILIWLSYSMEPLTLKTVAQVAYFPFENSVIEICTTALVTPSTVDDTIKLAHFSAKEFLTNTIIGENAWYHFSATTGHHAMLERSLSDLLRRTETLSRGIVKEEPLLVYAASNWRSHLTRVENDTDMNLQSTHSHIIRLFTEMSVYQNWMRLCDPNNDEDHWDMAPQEFEPSIYQASKMGLMRLVEHLLDIGVDPLDSISPPPYSPTNALTIAANRGYLPILELLLQRSTHIDTNNVLEILKTIDCRHYERKKLEVIFKLLWNNATLDNESDKPSKDIYHSIIRSAASNKKSGALLLSILFDWQPRVTIHLTEGVLSAVMNNEELGQEILQLIFKNQHDSVPMPVFPVWPLFDRSSHAADVVLLLIGKWGRLHLSDQLGLCKIAARASLKAMELLFPLCNDDLIDFEEILVTAARDGADANAFKFLMTKRKSTNPISRKVYLAAASNWSNGLSKMRILLDDCGPHTYMGEAVIHAAASNPNHGLEILKLFVERQQAGFVISETALAEAASRNTVEMIQLLMNNGGSAIPITEKIISAAAQNRFDPKSMIELFFDLCRRKITTTENILVSAAGNSKMDLGTFSRILNTFQDFPIPDKAFEMACSSAEKMPLLLDKPHAKIPMYKILEAIAITRQEGMKVLELFLGRQLILVNEQTIVSLLLHRPYLELLFSRAPDVPITEEALLGAVQKGELSSLRLLLNKWDNNKLVSEDILISAIGLYEPILTCQALFSRFGPKVSITERILMRAARRYHKGVFKLLLDQRRSLDLQAVWEAVWQGNCYHKQEVSSVIHRYTYLHVSECMLKRMTEHLNADFDDGIDIGPFKTDSENMLAEDRDDARFDGLIRFCVQNKISVSSSLKSTEIILERCCEDAIQLFLESQQDFQVTAGHLEMAKSNRRGNEEALTSLLLERIRAQKTGLLQEASS